MIAFVPPLCTTSAMTASPSALWETLSTEQKYELAGLAASLSTNSSEVSDNDPTMEKASDDAPVPVPMPVHAVFTMK